MLKGGISGIAEYIMKRHFIKLSTKDRNEIMQMYLNGVSIRKILHKFHIWEKHLYQVLGTIRRRQPAEYDKWSPIFIALYKIGKTTSEIVEATGRNRSYVIYVLTRAGINNNNFYINKQKRHDIIAQEYVDGSTLRELEKKYSLHRTTLMKILKVRSIEQRSFGEEYHKKLLIDFLMGVDMRELTNRHDLSTSAIYNILKHHRLGFRKGAVYFE